MFGRYKCHACGRKFELLKDNRYTVSTRGGLSILTNGTEYGDAFDCPRCGTQNIVGSRYPGTAISNEEVSEDEQN